MNTISTTTSVNFLLTSQLFPESLQQSPKVNFRKLVEHDFLQIKRPSTDYAVISNNNILNY